jgi:hypothetical protein
MFGRPARCPVCNDTTVHETRRRVLRLFRAVWFRAYRCTHCLARFWRIVPWWG